MIREDPPGLRVVERGRRRRWWRRLGSPRSGFRYVTSDGRRIRSPADLARIRKLAIPPAWRAARISPSPRTRVQVVGLDGGGKAQYLYRASFRARQDRRKFDRVERFAEYLPNLRRVTSDHLQLPGLPKDRVLAIVVRLINRLYFRVGSEDGVRRYRTYGATTLRTDQLRLAAGGRLEFHFDGKHHVRNHGVLVDERLATALAELQALGPGPLFRYRGADGRLHPVRGREVNEYVKHATAPEYTAKDFRTWAATLVMAEELAHLGPTRTRVQARRNVAAAYRAVAARLGNTPAVCKRAYVDPLVLRLYERGILLENGWDAERRIQSQQQGFEPEELALLDLFQRGRRRRTPGGSPAAATPEGPPRPSDVTLGSGAVEHGAREVAEELGQG